ncbi:MAG TPA: IS66 family insertion sequence element accessory protein TnpB [Candidatus Ozemobacteraceae bacterium]|nr:IS66 family insertion sequence element accessory protein TnpB [Candidatus Ozemobacteraceae bacterium]
MIPLASGAKVFLALGNTDMRKGIDGLSMLVARHLAGDPFSGDVFVFCNRHRTTIKLLLWDRNGFWVFHKRLERQKFRWPRSETEVLELGQRELNWLLDGLDPLRVKGHDKLEYSTLF